MLLSPGVEDDDIELAFGTIPIAEVDDLYIALSYTWGDQSAKKDIICCCYRLSVIQNLYSALQALRLEDAARVLWIDQLAINHRDLHERCEQVRLMGQIYSRAELVMVWLSDDIWRSKTLRDNMEMFYRVSEECFDIISESNDMSTTQAFAQDKLRQAVASVPQDIWDSVATVLRCPYFRRVWIIQEVLRSKHPLVMCGYALVGWHVIDTVNAFILNTSVSDAPVVAELRMNTRALTKIGTIRT